MTINKYRILNNTELLLCAVLLYPIHQFPKHSHLQKSQSHSLSSSSPPISLPPPPNQTSVNKKKNTLSNANHTRSQYDGTIIKLIQTACLNKVGKAAKPHKKECVANEWKGTETNKWKHEQTKQKPRERKRCKEKKVRRWAERCPPQMQQRQSA